MLNTEYGTFYGLGLGPGDPGLLTVKALDILRQVKRIYVVASRQSDRSVSRTILEASPGITAPVEELQFTMSNDWTERLQCIEDHAREILRTLERGDDCAFCSIGDPMTYSTCSYLLRALRRLHPALKSVIVPGVNSWSALAAKTQMPLVEDGEILRIVPSYREGVENLEFPAETTTILLKTYRSRKILLQLLPEDAKVCYGAEIGLQGEKLSRDRKEMSELPDCYLSMLAVKRGKQND